MAEGGTEPQACANLPDVLMLNVSELSNGAAVHRISNQPANKEPELFVLTGEPLLPSAVH